MEAKETFAHETSPEFEPMPLTLHDHAPLGAVDELASLRGELSRLRNREAELCDEIRSFATEHGGLRVSGETRDAVIEVRYPRRLDVTKLPAEVFRDRDFVQDSSETVVLIWPKSTSTVAKEGATEISRQYHSSKHAVAPDLDANDSSDDPFGLKAAPPRTPPARDFPPVTVGDATESETPRGLRPTVLAELQPMACLHEEEIALALAESDAPLASVTLPDALQITKTLEAQADLYADCGDIDLTSGLDFETDPSPDFEAAFATTRRVTGG